LYDLKTPNHEIKSALTNFLVKEYLGFDNLWLKGKITTHVRESLRDGKPEVIVEQIKVMFAHISYTNHIKNHLAMYEGYYSSVVYSFFYGIWAEIITEDTTNEGRINLVIRYENNIFILEFKVEKSWKTALEQIKDKNYAQKYGNYKVHLIGINFDMEKRQVESWEVE
jgi:hypothetical protein